MNKKELTLKIINHIPSNYVKESLLNKEHQFNDADLILLTEYYVYPFLEKLKTYEALLSIIKSKKLKKYLEKLIEYEKKGYQRLITSEEGFIYEIVMEKETRFGKYLVPDYDSCFEAIKTYLRCYQGYYEEPETYDICIYKREVKRRIVDEDIDDNSKDIRAELNHKLEILEIYDKSNDIYDHYNVPDFDDITYPQLFNKYDLIKIINPFSVAEHNQYGIIIYNENVAYVCSIDNEYVRNRIVDKQDENGYYPFFMHHNHIDYGKLELIDPTSQKVDKKIIEDYLYTKDTLIKMEKSGN